MKYALLLPFLLFGLARADIGWNKTLSLELCGANCSSTWSTPQISPDSASFVLAEKKNGVTSLWKFTLEGEKALLYSGALKAWTLESGPLLLGLDLKNTVFGYDVLKKKLLWTFAPIAFEITGVDVLFRGKVGVVTVRNPKVEGGIIVRETFDLANGKPLELSSRFVLSQSVPALTPMQDSSQLSPRYPVLEQTSNDSVWVALEQKSKNSVFLEVWTFDSCGCIACGCNPNKP